MIGAEATTGGGVIGTGATGGVGATGPLLQRVGVGPCTTVPVTFKLETVKLELARSPGVVEHPGMVATHPVQMDE